jgi:RNA polymerase sigma factor (sigma-70 family)
MNRESRPRPLARAVLRTQSDHRLVALSREGRESAFEEIVRRYRPGLVAFAAAYAPSDGAEDVVQESLASAWQSLHESDTEIQLKPWLYTIVRNRALNVRRDTRPHEQLTEELDGVRRPDEIALTNEELDRAVAAVGALPEPQRRALVRSALDGRTHEQIAAELGSTPGAVGQLVFRARAALRMGLGALIPLPLIRLLLEPAGPAAAGATGAGAAAAAAGGASVLAKGAVVALIGVAAVGSGVAIDRASKSDARDGPAAAGDDSGEPASSSDSSPATTVAGDRVELESGDDRGSGEPESGHDRGGDSGSSGPSASSGPSRQSGESGSGGSGSGDSGHSGHGGSGSSGSGEGTTTTTTETAPLDETDGHSGSGSGGDSSGSGGSSGPD